MSKKSMNLIDARAAAIARVEADAMRARAEAAEAALAAARAQAAAPPPAPVAPAFQPGLAPPAPVEPETVYDRVLQHGGKDDIASQISARLLVLSDPRGYADAAVRNRAKKAFGV